MASRFNKSTPEYEVFHEYQDQICDALSELPNSITPLASALCSAKIIMRSTMTSISACGLTPYDRAYTVMTAVGTSIEQDTSKFNTVLDKLSDHGLEGLTEEMYESLEANIEEKKRGKKKRRGYYRGPRCRPKSSAVRRSAVHSRTLRPKQQLKILVVGHNGSGKSSLINEILGQDIAIVGGLAQETTHDVVVTYRGKVGELDVTVYDTRGFGDSSITDQNTVDSIVDGIKSIDIVLICHRLYDRVDGTAKKEMEVLVDSMDDDLVDLSILVFTFGDDCLSRSRCDPEFTNDGRLTEDSKEEIKEAMEVQQHQIEGLFKDALKNNGITKEHAELVPSCITCGKRKKNGDQKELPTSDNWVDDLWELIEQRCKPEARPLVHSTKNTIFSGIRTTANRIWSWITISGKKK